MKLFLLSQEENRGYDTYDFIVVAAEDEAGAIRTSPTGSFVWDDELESWIWLNFSGDEKKERYTTSDWANSLLNISVKHIGEAKSGIKAGVICASFNAG